MLYTNIDDALYRETHVHVGTFLDSSTSAINQTSLQRTSPQTLLTDDKTRSRSRYTQRAGSCEHTIRVVVGLRPKPGTAAYHRTVETDADNGIMRGQCRIIQNGIQISGASGLRRRCIIENRSNRTQAAGQLWRTRNIPINFAQAGSTKTTKTIPANLFRYNRFLSTTLRRNITLYLLPDIFIVWHLDKLKYNLRRVHLLASSLRSSCISCASE